MTRPRSASRDAQRDAAAERMRASRERRKYGLRTVLVDIHDDEVRYLVSRGHLASHETDDRNEIANAIEQVLVDLTVENANDQRSSLRGT